MKIHKVTGQRLDSILADFIEVKVNDCVQVDEWDGYVTAINENTIAIYEFGSRRTHEVRDVFYVKNFRPAKDWFLPDGTKVKVGMRLTNTQYPKRVVARADGALVMVDGGFYSGDRDSRRLFHEQGYTLLPESLGEQLPNTLHELLSAALTDLRRVEAGDSYVPDMGTYHSPRFDGRCSVCLAGSMLCGLMPPTQNVGDVVDEVLWQKLRAVDLLRLGAIKGACTKLGLIAPPELPARVDVPNYSDDKPGFYAALEVVRMMLEAAGL